MLRAIATTGHEKPTDKRVGTLLRAAGWLLAMTFALAASTTAHAQAITRFIRTTGNINHVATGGSLRNAANAVNPCSLNATSSQALTGIPVGATIRAAYLYWGGSGSVAAADYTVTLNGNTVTAPAAGRFAVTATAAGPTLVFFGGRADVTTLITGNATLTFGGLTVNNGAPYCAAATTSTVVAGWSVVVIYELAAEPLRAINIFDGLDYFFGSSVTAISNGFRIPTSSIDGKMTVVTWEGDITNSTPQNGFSESLTFNGSNLTDGIDIVGSNPAVQEYDGTINSLGLSNTYGVDVDSYNISSLLAPGQTSATSIYSAGGDMVLLTAKVVSVTSEPVVDLSIAKSHVGNLTVGTNGVYSIAVSNLAGSQTTDFPITVTDTLPAGLTYVSGTGTGWSCGAVAQVVTCTHAGPVAAGNALPTIALTVNVGNAAFPSVTNNAAVTTPSYDPDATNNSANDATTVLGPNLTTSTKTVVDLNGGDANPGDTLRYTITVRESAGIAATAVSVTDDVPINVSGFSVVSFPVGATNSSTGAGTGNNGTGFLNIVNISVPANGSVTIVFDVQVAAGTSPGATINNTASITNPAGTDPNVSAPQVIVSASQIPALSRTKQLYLLNGLGLSRVRPAAQATVTIDEGATSTWLLTTPLQQPLTLNAGTFPVWLQLSELNNGNTRNVTVTLTNSVLGTIGSVAGGFALLEGTPTLVQLVLNTAGVTAPTGSTFSLIVTNTSSGSSNRQVLVHQPGVTTANSSRIELNSASVVNVNSVNTYNAAFSGGVVTPSFLRGLSTVYVRAVVSDPFGSFDITSATVTLVNPASATIVNAVAMTQVADSGTATKTYEFAYVVPSNAVPGTWNISVRANEGVEGVFDEGAGSFMVAVPMPSLLVSKISQLLSDPVNGSGANRKAIPGALIEYAVSVTNTGPGAVDASTLAITDVIPAGTAMFVDTAGGDPVEFIDGATPSGLSYNYAAHVGYSIAVGGGAPYGYSPTADANGVDLGVTGVRIAPTGAMPGAVGVNQPSFVIRFRVRVR